MNRSKNQTHDGDVSLDLTLSIAQISLCRQCVSSFHCVYNGDVGEEHDEHRHEEAEDENGDDVGLMDGGIIGFHPVDLTRAVTSICQTETFTHTEQTFCRCRCHCQQNLV